VSAVVAAVLFLGVVLYAVFGGADYGAGFWDLTAGGATAGRGPRALIDHSLGPVWEANHVWLIYSLVVMWTAFPAAFAAIMTTLYLPLGLAALGIVLRGSGFAFRKVVVRTPEQRVTGAAFAVSSLLAPFFLGAVAGGIASGRVPAGGHGDPVTSWSNPTSLLAGVLAVAAGACLAAVNLTAEARLRGETDLEGYFRRRAAVAAAVTGVLSIAAFAVLAADAHRLFTRLLTTASPLVGIAVTTGTAALLLLWRAAPPRVPQVLAATAVGAIVTGWGVAQYPYLLGTHLSVAAAAAPGPTLVSVLVVFGAAAVLVIPSLVLLYVLAERGELGEA
jgi:cytochrome d ubiquinol oxidase subunit II